MRRPLAGLLAITLWLAGCGSGPTGSNPVANNPGTPPPPQPPPPPPPPTPPPTWNVDSLGIPRFVTIDYIELAKIQQISKFRSSAGHDYSDDFESCRSMKHYYMPRDSAAAVAARIFSPVAGKVELLYPEWAGTQIRIRPTAYPAFTIVLFHVQLSPPLVSDQMLTAGQPLGTHIGPQTSSDVAVRVDTPTGQKLVSWFDTMTDAVFASYQARGMASRTELIITRAARDADPLTCVDGGFTGFGTLPQWVVLR